MYQLIEGDISWNFRLLFSSHRMCRSSALALFCLCSTRPFPRGDNSFSLSSRHNERLQPAPHDHLIDVMWFKHGLESSWVYSAISVLQKCPNHFPLICTSPSPRVECVDPLTLSFKSRTWSRLRSARVYPDNHVAVSEVSHQKFQLGNYATILRVLLLARCSRHLQFMPGSLSTWRARSGLKLTCLNASGGITGVVIRYVSTWASLRPPDPELNTGTEFYPAWVMQSASTVLSINCLQLDYNATHSSKETMVHIDMT